MVTLILENVPLSLRGELSRWLIEPQAGVFVGRVSARVRELLWIKCKELSAGGRGTMIRSASTEMGLVVEVFGDSRRTVVDCEGIPLIRMSYAPNIKEN